MSSNFHQPSCLDNCLATFGNIIVPGDRDFDKVCKILSAKSADSTFSWLYCCDLNHCGIGFGSSAGLDSNVNEVINTCKGFGNLNIVDPGPPQASQCPTILASTAFATPPVFSAAISSSQLSTPTPSPFKQSTTATSISTAIYSSTLSQQTTLPISLAISSAAPTLIFTDSIIPLTPTPTSSPSLRPLASNSSPLQRPTALTAWQKLTPAAKAGSILGLTLFLLLLLILALLFLKRHKRWRLLASQLRSSSPEEETHSPRSSPTLTEDHIRERGGVNGRYDVILIETEGKNSADSKGIRWPDSVVLTGDAKEMREWSLGYGREDRGRRELGPEKRFGYEAGVQRA